MVEGFVFLELDFGEEDGAVAVVFGGEENAVDSKVGFFDFDGLEAVVLRVGRGIIDQFKQEAGRSLEQGIENCVSSHGEDG